MAAPYSSVTVSGYNANPPADDGSATSANTIYWNTIKTKLNDTLKTAIEAINTNNIAAFAKVLGGGGVTSTATDYTVDLTDQGKLVRATASGITITTPDATAVLSPFVYAVLNNSSGSITLDGNGAQTIDGNASITFPAGSGSIIFTDGSNHFTTGIQGTLVGKQLMYADIINGTLVESNGSNAVTFALKTLAGADPSAADPVLLCFRNATVGTGNYIYRQVTAALSLTISSGSTMGASNATAFRVWIVFFDDAGTIRLGAINCLSGTNIYPLGQNPIASSTAEGGAGGADSAQVFYTGTAVSSKAYLILGHCSYESGLSTAGNWNVSPTRIRLHGHGSPLPGHEIQKQENETGAVSSGTTVVPNDDTIPQITEGDQYMTQAITPTSAANILRMDAKANLFSSSSSVQITSLFQDSTANALVSDLNSIGTTSSGMGSTFLHHSMLAGTTSSTTIKLRSGGTGGTMTFNGVTAARKLGGVMNSYLTISEIMA